MLRRTVGSWSRTLLVFAAPAVQAGDGLPPAWSPDGEWVAYVSEVPATPATPAPLATSWIFEGKDASTPRQAPRSEGSGARGRHRLWASRPGSDAGSTLLDDSPGPISAPAWRPDGKALAFARVVPTPGGHARFEVVRLEGADRRVLFSQPVDIPARDTPALVGSCVGWSPDGRFLAVPRLRPSGLAIVRAENGTVVKSIESATSPTWAPIGGRLFYLIEDEGGRARIECLDSHLGAPRRVAEVGQADGPFLVARDGQSLILPCRSPIALDTGGVADRVDLYRIRVADDGRRERVMASVAGPLDNGRGVAAASLSQDRDGENLFLTLAEPGQPCQVSWLRPRERSVHKLFPVLDPTLPLGDLALSPDGSTLALRVGEPGLPALVDLDSMTLTPLAPDADARDAWLALLLTTSRTILREAQPIPIHAGRAVDRAVAPPIPGELDASSDALARLRRLARAARGLIGTGGPPAVSLAREEARFLFDYLREDYPAALADLDRLAAIEPTDERRLKVVGLRGQVFAGMGEFDRARDAFLYLRGIEPGRARRVIETTSIGPVVSDPITPDAGWADYALGRIDLLARATAKEEADNPIDHRNPDAPIPGLGLDPDPFVPMPPVPPGDQRFRPRGERLPDPPVAPR